MLDGNAGFFERFGAVGAEAQDRYVTDWSRDLTGRARVVVRPTSTEEVAAVVRHCAEQNLAVVPQGGHTGLVGGATPSPEGGEVVISLERLDRVREIDAENFTMTVEAGCILEKIHAAAAVADRLFPLQLSAQGSCQIGGNIATNAGGLNVVRYGMTRDLVLGVEAVLADGQVWNGLRKLRKNNTGYDLKQLFLGSEGTLGIVTAACLKLFPKPTQVETAFLAVESSDAAVALFGRARRDLSDLLSAFELLPRRGVELGLTAAPQARDPLEAPSPFYVLMEVTASGLLDLKTLVERFLEGIVIDGLVADGALAASGAQAAAFWQIREGLIEAQARQGRHLRTDVSIPISGLASFLDRTHAALADAAPGCVPLAYGHLGDGNIHFNVLPPAGLDDVARVALLYRCEAIIFAEVDAASGSISAEHGIGRVKRSAFLARTPPLDLALLRKVKSALDPAGLMSPGRIFE
ncbi:FAD-binding oxidoreductase [Lichenihabitans sp. Uapishka_5]|uniref:FAD-binding oxidoreductase n=1 Tax=Lichenihabitans sp. Uapishka_5 TaxID=3037302 RepID=UPI0029E80F05|nr:FAD-binding oxidoreductase [Lichenihabitans sp. Uapishka_5]MDX7950828.1 FAD-binding oxidoreductase [Lichenihabitans sp. Uapishka_5]